MVRQLGGGGGAPLFTKQRKKIEALRSRGGGYPDPKGPTTKKPSLPLYFHYYYFHFWYLSKLTILLLLLLAVNSVDMKCAAGSPACTRPWIAWSPTSVDLVCAACSPACTRPWIVWSPTSVNLKCAAGSPPWTYWADSTAKLLEDEVRRLMVKETRLVRKDKIVLMIN